MKSKTKRVRTTFTEEQVQVLQANFQLDSNPDGQDLERIAQITGLSKRVTQVWFQNSRARQKKQQQQTQNGNSSPSPGSSPSKISSKKYHFIFIPIKKLVRSVLLIFLVFCVVLCCVCLRPLFTVCPVSLDCHFFVVPSVFSNVGIEMLVSIGEIKNNNI